MNSRNQKTSDIERLLADNTVLTDLMKPLLKALQKVRYSDAIFNTFGMLEFITLGVVRHLKSMNTLRETVQFLIHHLDSDSAPVARSTYSDAMASPHRKAILQDLGEPLLQQARNLLPDRLDNIPQLDDRAVYAVDGTYQKESAHYNKLTPSQGGKDNPKGHMLLTFYDVRLGCPCDVKIKTESENELATLKRYDADDAALTNEKSVLWLVDRAYIDASFWDLKKRHLNSTMITRMKSNLLYGCIESREVADLVVNEGVISDDIIALNSSKQPWRLINYRTRRGKQVEFLTNDLTLPPGLIAFLYSRRWDEEKCFDTWKNDFAQAKAWGKSKHAIDSQARLAIITSILLTMLVNTRLGKDGSIDEKSIDKQEARHDSQTDGTDRPDWSRHPFSFTSKISRQVLRFFQQCLFKNASPSLYKKQLKPMLIGYL